MSAACRKNNVYRFNTPLLVLLCWTPTIYSLERSNTKLYILTNPVQKYLAKETPSTFVQDSPICQLCTRTYELEQLLRDKPRFFETDLGQSIGLVFLALRYLTFKFSILNSFVHSISIVIIFQKIGKQKLTKSFATDWNKAKWLVRTKI